MFAQKTNLDVRHELSDLLLLQSGVEGFDMYHRNHREQNDCLGDMPDCLISTAKSSLHHCALSINSSAKICF